MPTILNLCWGFIENHCEIVEVNKDKKKDCNNRGIRRENFRYKKLNLTLRSLDCNNEQKSHSVQGQ